MPTVTSTKRERLIKYLANNGFAEPFTVNKHSFMIKAGIRLCIPNAKKPEVGKELLRRILKQADLKTE
jgi:predicted RNA binding protein YcfA (HicA-like mRNA interferase family)